MLYLGLILVSGVLFGAAMYKAGTLTPPASGMSQDDWWRVNLARAVGIWALVETLIAPFTGLLMFVNYRPSRLAEA